MKRLQTTTGMRYLLLVFSCLGLSLGGVWSQDLSRKKEREKYDYLVYAPRDHSTSQRSYPLVISLHGTSLKGNDLRMLKRYGLPQLVDQGKEYEFIIASPQCPLNRSWTSHNWLEPLLEELAAKYRIDPKRIYLTGVSMGGYGTWQTAASFPDIFAAIVPLCGWMDDMSQLCRIKNMPIWTFHGTDDTVIPIGETERIVSKLKQCKSTVNLQFTRLENTGHSIHNLYENEAIYQWMLKHHK